MNSFLILFPPLCFKFFLRMTFLTVIKVLFVLSFTLLLLFRIVQIYFNDHYIAIVVHFRGFKSQSSIQCIIFHNLILFLTFRLNIHCFSSLIAISSIHLLLNSFTIHFQVTISNVVINLFLMIIFLLAFYNLSLKFVSIVLSEQFHYS